VGADVLQMLLANPGQLVTREELRSTLWPTNTFIDFDHGLNKAINKLREGLGDYADSPRFVETLAKRGYRFIGSIGSASGRIESLAVLPLENLSHDPEQDYFAHGLTEALITYLAKISALQAVSRTSVMRYKGAHGNGNGQSRSVRQM
jgi:DNA-binding winged helix-turn-helix (wHTH) protein